MSVVVILEALAKNGLRSEIKELLNKLLPDTRKQEGCSYIDVYYDTSDDNKVILIEHWDSLQQYKKYRLWRIKSGVMENFGSLLEKSPSVRILQLA